MSCTRTVMDKLQSVSTQITGTGTEKVKFGNYILLAGLGGATLAAATVSPGLILLSFLITYPTGVYFQCEGTKEARKIQVENIIGRDPQRAMLLPEVKPESNIVSRCLRK